MARSSCKVLVERGVNVLRAEVAVDLEVRFSVPTPRPLRLLGRRLKSGPVIPNIPPVRWRADRSTDDHQGAAAEDPAKALPKADHPVALAHGHVDG